MNNISDYLKKDNIGEPPYEYNFLYNLPESEYPKYLKKIFKYRTGENLNLKHPKTFNEKIQWIKLYGVTQLMRDCTDKVKVRDYVRERIGEEYLKPVLQIIPENTANECDVIANHDSILDGEAIQRNLRKGETRVTEGIAYDSDSEVCDLPERQQIQRQEEVKHETGNENLGIKPKFQAVDCRGTQNVIVPRLRFPKFQFRENWVLAEYNDGALVFKDNDNKNYDVSTYFDKIDFNKLPDSFVIKTNHGCKWQYIIKSKNKFLSNKRLSDMVKRNITGWLEQDFSFWGGFEMQYKTKFGKFQENSDRKQFSEGIFPKLLVEKLLREQINTEPSSFNVYCFNGVPKILVKFFDDDKTSIWDENFEPMDNIFNFSEENIKTNLNNKKNQTFDLYNQNCELNLMKKIINLSKKLSKDFNFVRIDWMIYQNKLYFEELTFTPASGYTQLNKKWNKKLGSLIKI